LLRATDLGAALARRERFLFAGAAAFVAARAAVAVDLAKDIVMTRVVCSYRDRMYRLIQGVIYWIWVDIAQSCLDRVYRFFDSFG
jgi:hypothetical protein